MKQYEKSLGFWDSHFENIEPQEIGEWDLGCEVLQTEISQFCKDRKNILDFGCGSGWATHFMSTKCDANILAIDPSSNGIKYADATAKLNHYDKAKFIVGDDKYLDTLADNSFDGFYSNNVFDVIPTSLAEEIFAKLQRVLTPDARLLISINYEITEEDAQRNNMEKFDGNCYAMDGVLRMVNYSHDEWKKILGKYFELIDFKTFHYDFDKRPVERRIFLLKNCK